MPRISGIYVPNWKEIEQLRQSYPEGTRVCLVKMKDPFRNIPVGTLGTVKYVDDIGTIHVAWDSFGQLGVAYGEDMCEKVQ